MDGSRLALIGLWTGPHTTLVVTPLRSFERNRVYYITLITLM